MEACNKNETTPNKNKELIKLNKTGNDLRDGGASALSEALKVNTALTALIIESAQQQQGSAMEELENSNERAGSQIGIGGALALSEALKVNTTLTALDLRGVQQQENAKKERSQQQNRKQITRPKQKEHVR